jgi:hypothetical protein
VERVANHRLLGRVVRYLVELAAGVALLGIAIAAIDGTGHLVEHLGLDSQAVDTALIVLAVIAFVVFCAIMWPRTVDLLKELWSKWRSR